MQLGGPLIEQGASPIGGIPMPVGCWGATPVAGALAISLGSSAGSASTGSDASDANLVRAGGETR
jgi:hypothetical protein